MNRDCEDLENLGQGASFIGVSPRQREGIALAKQRGAYRGLRRSLTTEQISELHARAAAGAPKALMARELGVSRETVYQHLPSAAGGV